MLHTNVPGIPYNKDYSTSGPLLGFPCFGKLPHRFQILVAEYCNLQLSRKRRRHCVNMVNSEAQSLHLWRLILHAQCTCYHSRATRIPLTSEGYITPSLCCIDPPCTPPAIMIVVNVIIMLLVMIKVVIVEILFIIGIY